MSEIIPRRKADDEFRRLLIMHGVSALKARLYWLAVRGFGWLVWQKHTPDSVKSAQMFVEILPA
jgi:hypothetical protein